MRRLITDLSRVLDFARNNIPGFAERDGMVGFGVESNGQMIAAAIYENINKHNAWVHVAGTSGKAWLCRSSLRALFFFAFQTFGLQRLTAHIDASNTASIRFVEHLGFEKEAVLKCAAIDGGDVFIYRMFKKDCRYVQMAHNRV